MLALLIGLMLAPTAVFAAADPAGPQQIEVRAIAGSPAQFTVVAADPDDAQPGQTRRFVMRAPQAVMPKIWIGVRISPLPAPLAAHLGEGGVMIQNVVVGSPADQAGLQQYDVVQSFNGQPIEKAQDLTDAIAKVAAGSPAQLSIVRKAKPVDVQVTPIEPPADAATAALKYDEPESLDAAFRMRGHTLQKDPAGNWIWQDLGPMHGFPDLRQHLQKFNIKLGPDDNLRFFADDLDPDALPDLGDADQKLELKVRIEKDGVSTLLHRAADGSITVTRTDADGQETTNTYENADALRDADPEAFALYSRHVAAKKIRVFGTGPQGGQIHIDVQQRIDEALRTAEERANEAMQRANEALERAGVSRDEALKRAREALRDVRVEVRRQGDDDGGGNVVQKQEMLTVIKNDSGALKIVHVRDGDEHTYTYKNVDELKAQNPDLYERVKGTLGE